MADLGLSVDIYSRNYFRNKREGEEEETEAPTKFPIRWMAPYGHVIKLRVRRARVYYLATATAPEVDESTIQHNLACFTPVAPVASL